MKARTIIFALILGYIGTMVGNYILFPFLGPWPGLGAVVAIAYVGGEIIGVITEKKDKESPK